MLKYILLGTIAYTALVYSPVSSAYAQETEHTDQSEEDWRNSQRKQRSNDDFDPITNPNGIGNGITLPPLEPIDTLPEESKRHLQRQRAKVIAEMEFGEDVGDIPYEPSKAAKNDPALAAEEEEVWEVILTDLQGGNGGDQQGEGGPNKVVVAGRGGGSSSPSSVTRGGSAQSASDILKQLKGLQSGNGRVQSGRGSGGTDQQPQSTQTGGSQSAGQSGGQGQQPQQPQQAGQNGQAGQPQQNSDGQASTQGNNGQSSQSQTQGQDGGGQSQSDGQAQGGSGAGDSAGTGEAGENANTNTREVPTVPPLNIPKRQSTLGNGDGANSSASDYLKGVLSTTTPQSVPDTDEADD